MSAQAVRESVHPALTQYGRMCSYTHPVLLNKMQVECSLNREEAEELLDDVKRFLALCATTPSPLAPTRSLDRGWHLFILFTVDYASFCKQYCGRFIHHVPEDPFNEARDFQTVPRTQELASLVFGSLSSNWLASPMKADCCPDGCQGKDCSTNDCTSCKTSAGKSLLSGVASDCCRPCSTDPNA